MAVWITVGLPGSGKSTLAKMLRTEDPNLIIIERDEIYFSISLLRSAGKETPVVTLA